MMSTVTVLGKAALQESGCCECGLEEVVLKVAIVAAVGALAVAVLTGEIFAAIGFALFGAVCGWKLYETSATLEQIEQMSGQMQGNVGLLQTSTAQVTELTERLTIERRAFQQQREALTKEVDDLQLANRALKEAAIGWSREKLLMQGRVGGLTEVRKKLQEEVRALEGKLDLLAAQMKRFLEANLSLGKSVAALDGAGEALQGMEVGLREAIGVFDKEFDQNREEFQAALAAGESSIAELARFIGERYHEKEKLIGNLRVENEQLGKTEERLQAALAKLPDAGKQLEEVTRRLEETTEKFRKLEAQHAAKERKMREILERLATSVEARGAILAELNRT